MSPQFIIYDNGSTDSLRLTLASLNEELAASVIVEEVSTLCHMPGLFAPARWAPIGNPYHQFSQQGSAMMHALFTYGVSTKYMACIDVDEFLDTPKSSVIPEPQTTRPRHVPVPWTTLFPLDVAKGSPILSAQWFDSEAKRSMRINRTKTIVYTRRFLADIKRHHQQGLFYSIHRLGFTGMVADHMYLNAEHKLYHAWCRHSTCTSERRDVHYFTAAHNRTLANRLSLTRGPQMAPLLRWHHRVQTQLCGDSREKHHVMVYGIGRSGTSVAQFVLSARRLAVFEPCSIFDQRRHYDLFDEIRSARCRNLVRDLADCHITLDTFKLLQRKSKHTFGHWNSYHSWMQACWQMSLVIKEIRIDPVGTWRALPRFRFVHVHRNLTEVISSRQGTDEYFDPTRIAESWVRLRATALAHRDPTLAYNHLVSPSDSFLRNISAAVQLSPVDLIQTVSFVQRNLSGTHAFLRRQHLKQPDDVAFRMRNATSAPPLAPLALWSCRELAAPMAADTVYRASSSCQRCLRLQSTIVLSGQRTAGLGDRMNVLLGASNLAASLCARLVMAPPSEMLSPSHNGGVKLNDDVQWSRYFQAYRVLDGGQKVVWRAARRVLPANGVAVPIGRNDANISRADVVREYLEARAVMESGRRFTWYLNLRYHQWRSALEAKAQEFGRPPLMPFGDHEHRRREACSYVELELSSAVVNVSRAVLAATGLASPLAQRATLATFATLHVRRGRRSTDPLPRATCNTSVAAVLQYVRCSVSAAFAPTALLISTDETRHNYLSRLVAHLTERYRSTRAILVDQLISQLSPDWVWQGAGANRFVDNFFVFAVGRAIVEAASAGRLSMSHHACPNGTAICGERHTCHPCGGASELLPRLGKPSVSGEPSLRWDAIGHIVQTLSANAMHSGAARLSFNREEIATRVLTNLTNSSARTSPHPLPPSWPQPRVFVGGPCEGTTWFMGLARTLLALHDFPVHNTSADDGVPAILPELNSLETLRGSVEGAQRLGHTLVSKWSARASWGSPMLSIGAAAQTSHSSSRRRSESPVAQYLSAMKAHVVYFHRADLLARSVCMLRDFGVRRHSLQRIGRLVNRSTGMPAETSAERPAMHRRSLPTGAMPSVWVNTSEFIAYLRTAAARHQERLQAVMGAYQHEASQSAYAPLTHALYEDLSAFERSQTNSSVAVAASVSAWMRVLRAWGVTADARLVGRVLRTMAGTRQREPTAAAVYNWAELVRALRAVPDHCHFLGLMASAFLCEPELSCSCNATERTRLRIVNRATEESLDAPLRLLQPSQEQIVISSGDALAQRRFLLFRDAASPQIKPHVQAALLQCEGAGDACAGRSHMKWSLSCALAEALHLNRTLVLPDALCCHPSHCGGTEWCASTTRFFALHGSDVALESQVRAAGIQPTLVDCAETTARLGDGDTRDAVVLSSILPAALLTTICGVRAPDR